MDGWVQHHKGEKRRRKAKIVFMPKDTQIVLGAHYLTSKRFDCFGMMI